MSNTEASQFMKNVKWTTFFYAAFTIASLLISGSFAVAGIQGAIAKLAYTEQSHYVASNHKMDSLDHDRKTDIKEIWKAIKGIDSPAQTTKIVYRSVPKGNRYVIERYIGNKLTLIPVR